MDSVSEIKSRLSIVEVVEKYLPLKKAGRNFKGLCPFHNDTHPSLLVSPEKGLAWCFACQNGGDIFSFVQKVENVDFPETLKILANLAGVELQEASPRKTAVKKEQKLRLMDLLEEAQRYFRANFERLETPQKEVAKRKFSPEILKKFGIGYALDNFHALEKHLSKQGFAHKEMLEAGVVTTQDEKGAEVYDRFRERIIFPIWDLHDSIRGFGGRIIGTGEPKYLNSPETVLYDKSNILYGLNFAKDAIRDADSCLVVEGYFDVIACHNAGIENVVATSGVALSEGHVKLMQRFTQNLVFAFDSDSAGQEATKRGIETALKSGANVTVMRIPGGKDPDEALREDKSAFLAALEEKQSIIDFVLDNILQGKDISNLQDNRQILDEFFHYLQLIPKDFERDEYLKRLLQRTSLEASDHDRKTLEREIFSYQREQNRRLRGRGKTPEAVSARHPENHISSFAYLIGLISAAPDLFAVCKNLFLLDIAPAGLEKKFYNAFYEEYNAAGVLDPVRACADFPEEEATKRELWSLYAEEKIDHLPEAARAEEIKKLIRKLNKSFIERELQYITHQLKTTPRNSTQLELQKKHIDFIRLLHQL